MAFVLSLQVHIKNAEETESSSVARRNLRPSCSILTGKHLYLNRQENRAIFSGADELAVCNNFLIIGVGVYIENQDVNTLGTRGINARGDGTSGLWRLCRQRLSAVGEAGKFLGLHPESQRSLAAG